MKYFRLGTCSMLILLLVMLSLAFSPIIAVLSQTTTIVVEPATVSAHLGEPFIITVHLSNVQNLYGLEVILNWDPDVLRVENVDIRLGVETYSDGVLHESSSSPSIFIAENNLTETGGEYRLVATSMNPAHSFNGSGNIVRLTFDPLSLDESVLDLETQLLDYPPPDRDPRISLAIEHATMDAAVIVYESTSTPTPTSPTTPTPTSPTSTPTPTFMPTPTPSSSPEPPILNLRIEYILVILAIIIVVLLIYFYLRRLK